MDKKTRQNLLLIACGVAMFAAVTNLNIIKDFLGWLVGLLLPVLAGLVLAFVLSVPMNGIRRGLERLFSKAKRKPGSGALNALSLVLTYLCLVLVIALVGLVAVPEIVNSVKSISTTVKEKWPEWMAVLRSWNVDTDAINSAVDQALAGLDFGKLLQSALSGAGSVLGSAVTVATTTISGVTTAVFTIIIGSYVLLDKDDLKRQSKMLIYAHLRRSHADRFCQICSLIQNTFTRFLSGQCMEAVILGLLMFIAFSVFRLPYAGVVAMLTTILAFVPYIGAFAACFVGAVLTLIGQPSKLILCILVYQGVQFIENQFIYPRVVGSSVGLPPLWTLAAALLGGKLFGILGMIFFIPLVAVIYSLVRDNTKRRLQRRGLDPNDPTADPVEEHPVFHPHQK
ncbi:MAG: AI-2E family transporter [Candidatus Limivicinus sp.]|nr:AI-2E family transporter [Clostridiales bacterium]MCI7135858.1 AI-2E family transporter [Clostridiales bacterium]MDY6132222.1 AI-2E family transporter [Candidatus Limivicinus sp.]